MKDALGNTIIEGKVYGHSTRTSGSVSVVIGTAIEVTEKVVKLKILKRGMAIYEDDIKESKSKRSIISLTPNSVFPVNEKDISWELKN